MTWFTILQDWYFRNFEGSFIRDQLARAPHETNILISGLDGVGKTTLMTQHISRRGQQDITTTGYEVRRGPVVREVTLEYGRFMWKKQVHVYSYDVDGGRPKCFFEIEEQGYVRSDALVWVVDSCDQDRWVESLEELGGLLRCGDKNPIRKRPLLVLANKQSLRTTCEVFMSCDMIEEWFKSRQRLCLFNRPYLFVCTDMLSGEGIYQAFEWLALQLEGRWEEGQFDLEKSQAATEKNTLSEKVQ